jgi:hypothetical protein
MTPAEAAILSAYAEQCCPQQKFNEFTGDAWGDLMPDVRFVDAKEAVKIIARRSPWISPAEIIAEVKRVRGERIAQHGEIVPPADLDPDNAEEYSNWLRAARQAIGDGNPPPAVPELAKRDMRQLEGAFRRVPRGADR